ncbi:MAG: hypothetical protein ACRBCJ_08780 [Hyphomicrobiaceae bacterium]
MGAIVYVGGDTRACSSMRTLIDGSFQFFNFVCGHDTLKFLENFEGEVDAVITDERMSNVNASQLLKAVAAQWPNVARILAVSDTDFEALCKHVNESNIDYVIQLPMMHDKLTDLIRECVAQKKIPAPPVGFQEVENNLQLSIVRAELAAASLLQATSGQRRVESTLNQHCNNHDSANVMFEEISRLRKSIDQVTSAFSFKRDFIDNGTANLGECCKNALNQLKQRDLDVEDIEIDCNDSLSIKADGELLAAALSQLFANSLLATSDVQSPSINVSANRSGRDVVIQISDNGSWNDIETLSKILKDLDFVDKNDQILGTNIALWLLRENGGSVQFQPTQPFGMTAVITFPLLLQ